MEFYKNESSQVADLPAGNEALDPPHFSLADALEVVEGDFLLMREMARTFLRHAPALLQALQEGLHTGDSHQISRNLRELQERAASVGALALQEEAFHLQAALTAGGLAASASPYDRLPGLLDRFRESLALVDWGDLDDGFPA